MRSPLYSYAQALGGVVSGNGISAPGPGHSKHDRSLSVIFSPSAPDGFVCFSHAGDDPLRCKDYVRSRLGWSNPERYGQRKPDLAVLTAEPDNRQLAKIAQARAIWDASIDPTHTIVEAYLRSRLLDLPWQVAGESIRFHPTCPWRDEQANRTIQVPAMTAAMRSIEDGEIVGIHRTRLTSDGRKVGRRMLGKASGSAIMLCPYTAVGGSLAIGEGIETCLSGWQLGWSNVWALGSVSSIAAFPLITALDTLVIFAEVGDGGASSRATSEVGRRYKDDGREVLVVSAKNGDDLNDGLRRCA